MVFELFFENMGILFEWYNRGYCVCVFNCYMFLVESFGFELVYGNYGFVYERIFGF